MKIIPVIDVLGGVAVQAMGGVRQKYQPLKMAGCESSCPLKISEQLHSIYQLSSFYLADLDGIVHRQRNESLPAQLTDKGFELRIDWGLRSIEDLIAMSPCQLRNRIIIATESLAHWTALQTMVCMLEPSRLTVSIDLLRGNVICPEQAWPSNCPLEITRQINDLGIQELILLDLAYVGCERGLGTLKLCEKIRQKFPELKLLTGGGVRSVKHLQQLEAAGVDAVLLGSCLHQQMLSPTDIACYCSSSSAS